MRRAKGTKSATWSKEHPRVPGRYHARAVKDASVVFEVVLTDPSGLCRVPTPKGRRYMTLNVLVAAHGDLEWTPASRRG
jgi:hypothetical protein